MWLRERKNSMGLFSRCVAVVLPLLLMHINLHLPCQEFMGTWESLAKQKQVMARARCDTRIIAFFGFIMDNDLNTKFGDEIDHCLADMDLALCRHWPKMRPNMKKIAFLYAKPRSWLLSWRLMI